MSRNFTIRKPQLSIHFLTVCLLVGSISTSYSQTNCIPARTAYVQNFGNGARPATTPLTVGQVPELFYQAPPLNMDPEKIYTVTPTSDLHSNSEVWHHISDHTGPDVTGAPGRMMLINDREPVGPAYRDSLLEQTEFPLVGATNKTIEPGTTNVISYYGMNILRPGVCPPEGDQDIDVSIVVERSLDGVTWIPVATSPVMHVSSTAAPIWFNQSLSFLAPPLEQFRFIRFSINNSNTRLCGNDFVLDDISVVECAPGASLPLNLLNFSVDRSNSGINLAWKTADEINVKNFVVERSSDGRNFVTAYTKNAVGSGSNNYSLIDVNPNSGRNYYRLKMQDQDGKYKYSMVAYIDWRTNRQSILLYPNPAFNNMKVELPSEWRGNTTLIISNANGQTLITRLVQNSSVIDFDVNALKNGTYILKAINSQNQETQISKFQIFK